MSIQDKSLDYKIIEAARKEFYVKAMRTLLLEI